MIVTLADNADVDHVRRELTGLGLWLEGLEGSDHGPVQLVVGPGSVAVIDAALLAVRGVAAVSRAKSRHPRVDQQASRLKIGAHEFGGALPTVIAGPCAVESEEQIARIAAALARRGVRVLRGGAFKPRTSPYDFQGCGKNALRWLRRAADAEGMSVVTEVMSERDLDAVAAVADLLQIGSRNMQNFALLEAVGRSGKPVLLKRAMAATVDEWLSAAEYLLVHGASDVVFCERGLRGFDRSTRNLLDLGAVALLAQVHGLPVIADPSHAAGRRELILPLARAALAAGAQGVMIEVHDDPAAARSDGAQALAPEALDGLMTELRPAGVG